MKNKNIFRVSCFCNFKEFVTIQDDIKIMFAVWPARAGRDLRSVKAEGH